MKQQSKRWLMVLLLPLAVLTIALLTASFRSNYKNPQGAVAYTKSVTNITSTTATCNYRITVMDLGKVKGHGVCVATRDKPVITNMNFPSAMPAQRAADYMVKLTGFKPYATYYARSYIKVDTGVVYGNSIKFITLKVEK